MQYEGHYVENVGNTTLKFLEIFNTGQRFASPHKANLSDTYVDHYQDISLAQWLALIPPALVKAHLNLTDDMISHLNKTKALVVGPASSS